ncbi:MAG: TIGR02449 family protein [Gammaproteobacteria bacterium]|nr:MAG: TIGR02449 family protein [Gammaproteobacteria bacterium]
MAENQLKALEKKIDELIALCGDLNRENQSLKHDSLGWHDERLQLVANNDLARKKVEAMINRLQALEQES